MIKHKKTVCGVYIFCKIQMKWRKWLLGPGGNEGMEAKLLRRKGNGRKMHFNQYKMCLF